MFILGAGSHLGLTLVTDVKANDYYCSSTNSVGLKVSWNSNNCNELWKTYFSKGIPQALQTSSNNLLIISRASDHTGVTINDKNVLILVSLEKYMA